MGPAGVAAAWPGVVVAAFPASPHPEDRVLERVATREGRRGGRRVVVDCRGSGHARVGTEALLQRRARQPDGGQGVESGSALGLLGRRQSRFHLQEGGGRQDRQHQEGRHHQRQHEGEAGTSPPVVGSGGRHERTSQVKRTEGCLQRIAFTDTSGLPQHFHEVNSESPNGGSLSACAARPRPRRRRSRS